MTQAEEIIIREAIPEDADVISKLNHAVQKIHSDALPDVFKPPSDECFPASEIRKIIEAEDSYVLLALVEDQPAGYIFAEICGKEETARSYASEHLWIHHISVDDAFRRNGIGQKLIQEVRTLAEKHGISRIALDVWSFNVNAKKFFGGQGFTTMNEIMRMEQKGESP